MKNLFVAQESLKEKFGSKLDFFNNYWQLTVWYILLIFYSEVLISKFVQYPNQLYERHLFKERKSA